HMAVFLSRAFGLAEGPDPMFNDVHAGAWYAPEVAKLAASGITRGCGDGTGFCPNQNTTRGQMATFLARAVGLVETPGASTSTGPTSPPGHTWLSAGNNHACAIGADGSVVCWGDDRYGQTRAFEGGFVAVSAGGFHSCGIRDDNTMSCWGENRDRQLTRPRDVEFLTVSAGFRHSCAVATDNTVHCWGSDVQGRATPRPGQYSQVSAGLDHTCGLRTDKRIQCWGHNSAGQGGVLDPMGTQTCSQTGCWHDLALIAGQFTNVSAGSVHTCGVRTDNHIECWGDNQYGQSSPPWGQFLTVSSGFLHSCAVATDNTVHCWGRDTHGETRAPSGEFMAVSAGSSFSCGLRTDGSIQCWGSNENGRATPPAE
ncbi:MAG: S-layer homology domain-containing protein, partial [Gemmatimonadota bacterium]|nr:S-layer homology domain-containing protein [Gemmatimonadota bacterium]